MFLQPDPLPVGKSEQFVVVHDRVHVLHPQSIDIPIKQDILPLILLCRAVDFSEDVGEESVCPVSGDGVQNAIELNNCDSLGVHGVQFSGEAQPICYAGEDVCRCMYMYVRMYV